jgi:hypothetical protein
LKLKRSRHQGPELHETQPLAQEMNKVTLHTKQFRKADTNNFSLTVKTKASAPQLYVTTKARQQEATAAIPRDETGC